MRPFVAVSILVFGPASDSAGWFARAVHESHAVCGRSESDQVASGSSRPSRRGRPAGRLARSSTQLSLITYSSLPEADLESHLNFLKSDPGRHFVDVTIHALGAAMLRSAMDLGSALMNSKGTAAKRA